LSWEDPSKNIKYVIFCLFANYTKSDQKKCVSSDTFSQLIILSTVNTARTCAWVLIRESFDQFRKSFSKQTYIYRMQWLCKRKYFDSGSFFLKLNVKLWVCAPKLKHLVLVREPFYVFKWNVLITEMDHGNTLDKHIHLFWFQISISWVPVDFVYSWENPYVGHFKNARLCKKKVFWFRIFFLKLNFKLWVRCQN
jgi:hypothetical protein